MDLPSLPEMERDLVWFPVRQKDISAAYCTTGLTTAVGHLSSTSHGCFELALQLDDLLNRAFIGFPLMDSVNIGPDLRILFP